MGRDDAYRQNARRVLREYDLASFPRLLDQQQRQQRQTTSQYAHVGGALAAPPFHGKQESFSNLDFFYFCPTHHKIIFLHTVVAKQEPEDSGESTCKLHKVDD